MPALKRTMAVLVTIAAFVATASPAYADKVSTLQSQVDQVVRRQEQLRSYIEAQAEKINEAQIGLAKVEANIAATQQAMAAHDASLGALNDQMAKFAVAAYIYGDQTNGVGALVTEGNVAEGIAQRKGYSPIVMGENVDVTDQVKAAREDTARLAHQLETQQTQQQQLLKTVSANKAAAERATTDLSALEQSLKADVRQAVVDRENARIAAEQAAARARAAQLAEQLRQQQAAAAAAARAAAAAGAATTGTRTGTGTATGTGTGGTRTPAAPQAPPASIPDYPAPSPGAARAVATAKAQLGKPYVFATSGPDTFDCSGLTAYAWASAGVSMEHWTVAQYRSFPHVPLDALAPGDLVFFGADIHHVGMYIGGGLMIHAPYTGSVVQISSVFMRGIAGAVRPG
jgi:cell wall-associated NlpC family hydrolase